MNRISKKEIALGVVGILVFAMGASLFFAYVGTISPVSSQDGTFAAVTPHTESVLDGRGIRCLLSDEGDEVLELDKSWVLQGEYLVKQTGEAELTSAIHMKHCGAIEAQ